MISSLAHLAVKLQSLEASLHGHEAEGPVVGRAGREDKIFKNLGGCSLKIVELNSGQIVVKKEKLA